MAIIEDFEIKYLKHTITKPITYIVWLLFLSPLLFLETTPHLSLLCFIALVFAIIFIVDIKHYIIPDSAQIVLFACANYLVYNHNTWFNAYAGMLLSLLIFGGIYFIYEKLLNKPALGFGDVKLLATAGLFTYATGFNYFLWILTIISSVIIIARLFIKNKNKLIPYGPMIVISLWVCIIFKPELDLFFLQLIN